MKKKYLTPSILVVEYNKVDIVTESFVNANPDWLPDDWLNGLGGL